MGHAVAPKPQVPRVGGHKLIARPFSFHLGSVVLHSLPDAGSLTATEPLDSGETTA